MHAVYMKSVRSPHMAHIPSRFKLQYDYDRHLDVFSQAPAEDEGESRYEEDSFCVNSDYMDEESGLKLSVIFNTQNLGKGKNS